MRILFQFYLIIAIINWVPFVSPSIVNLIKYFTLTSFVILNNGYVLKGNTPFSRDKLIFILLCLVIPAILNYGGPFKIVTNLVDNVFPFILVNAIINSKLSKEEIVQSFKNVCFFVAFISF